MNDKIQAILFKIVVELKKIQWSVDPDWELTFKSENHVLLTKSIKVEGTMGSASWFDSVETTINLTLVSGDGITYFPSYGIYCNIHIRGGGYKDIAYKADGDVAFTQENVKDNRIAKTAATQIDHVVNNYIDGEYTAYVEQNAAAIRSHRQMKDDSE
jgi:hypothetical protein